MIASASPAKMSDVRIPTVECRADVPPVVLGIAGGYRSELIPQSVAKIEVLTMGLIAQQPSCIH